MYVASLASGIRFTRVTHWIGSHVKMVTSPSGSNAESSSHRSVLANSTVSSVLIDGSTAGAEMVKQTTHLTPETGPVNQGTSCV